ncbi:MAG: type II toxin-antitoxin system VapC family toxin [Methyloligella sp. ZOD6]
MAGAETVYYWDTCLFLAWIQDEARPTGEMDGVREVIERCKRREVKIITSVLTSVEVLQSKLPAGMDTLFAGLMKRITRLSIDAKVASVAHDIRNYYQQRIDQFDGKKLTTPDAIHLATGVLYRVTEFHTFDDGKSDKKSIGLINLSGDVGGNNLKICKPTAKNPGLDLRPPTEPKGS